MLNNEERATKDFDRRDNDNTKLVIIFCTKNSESTIESAITNVKQSRYDPDVVVVDGFSTDNTVKIAKDLEKTTVIEQPVKKFPGKGIAMRAGLEEILFKKYSNNNKIIKNNVADGNKTNNRYDLYSFS